MTAKRRWQDLSVRQRRLLLGAVAAEVVLKVAALIDLKRRPADEVRGPKWLWATSVGVIGSAGILPLSYFLIGRRRTGG
jgi:hypothetical protein